MTNTNNTQPSLPAGARILSAAEAATVNLGPLADLVGSWTGAPGDGFNLISVPSAGPNGGPGGFTLEIIPYSETLTFTPVVQALNRGVFNAGTQEIQEIAGVMYQQVITSACTTAPCKNRGFQEGQIIHAETGLILYVNDCTLPNGSNDPSCADAPLSIARLSTIPHGNSLLAMGTYSNVTSPGNNFFPVAASEPKMVNSSDGFSSGYTDPFGGSDAFPNFTQGNPNAFLATKLGNQVITSMTTISMSTQAANAGILSIPFTNTNVQTLNMEATFWIERIAGAANLQLQYSQTINLQFPGTDGNNKVVPVIWPHITINTLTKVSDQ